jgi:hypothetical protein
MNDDFKEELKDCYAEIERLRAECQSLAAWACIHPDGKTGIVCGEGGSQYCAKDAEIERLNSELTDALTDLNSARQDNASCTVHIHNQADRIEKLEAALREIDTVCSNPGNWSPVVMERIIERVQELSRAALTATTEEKQG